MLTALLLAALLANCAGGDGEREARIAALPKVSGAFGERPKITYDPRSNPGTTTRSAVLIHGTGPKVAKGDLLVADVVSQIYETKRVYDDSFSRSNPSQRFIGVGRALPAWDKTLVGVIVGSRVLMVVPPADAHGNKGQPEDGIKGSDTLIFVVDVVGTYRDLGPHTAPAPVSDLPGGLPKVTGDLGQRPTVTVPDNAVPPRALAAIVLAKGTGPPVESNTLTILHEHAVSWAGKILASTWDHGGPDARPVGIPGQAHPLDALVGAPIGSRVLIVLPPQGGRSPRTDSIAVVVDVLAQHGRTKKTS